MAKYCSSVLAEISNWIHALWYYEVARDFLCKIIQYGKCLGGCGGWMDRATRRFCFRTSVVERGSEKGAWVLYQDSGIILVRLIGIWSYLT